MKTLFVFLCYCCCVASIAQSQVQPGLDSTFGKKGILIDTARSFIQACDMAVQPDGKIVVASADYVARYQPDGRPDSCFGHKGLIAVTTLTDSLGGYAANVFLMPDGKILLSGRTSIGAYVLRLRPDGTFDSSFGKNGKTLYCCGGLKAALQSDGKILTMGPQNNSYVAIHRFMANGRIDSSFGNYGFVLRLINTNGDQDVAGMGLLADGRIGIVGGDRHNVYYARYFADGKPDTTLNSSGVIYPTGTIYCMSAIVYSNGRVLAAKGGLNFSEDAELASIKADGTLDSNFGTNGVVAVPGLHIHTLLQMPDGRILCGGWNDSDFAVVRMNKDGIDLDRSFGRNGIITTEIEWNNDRVSALALQPDGRILAGGKSKKDNFSAYPRASIVRYLPDAPAPPLDILPFIQLSAPTLVVSPNPATTRLFVRSSSKGRLQLFTTSGQFLQELSFEGNTKVIMVSELPPGCYMLRLLSHSAIQTTLFSKE